MYSLGTSWENQDRIGQIPNHHQSYQDADPSHLAHPDRDRLSPSRPSLLFSLTEASYA